MLGNKGSIPPFTLFRYKAMRNPLVELPKKSQQILDKVTHCLITHLHPDHIDKSGEEFLISKKIPVLCNDYDKKVLFKKGLNVKSSLSYWKSCNYLGGKIVGIPAKHGYGWISKPMGKVMGFYLELPNSPSIYISADTIFTDDVTKVLTTFKPDIAVVACGTARLDFGKPLLMTINDVVKFIKIAPKKIIANHLEALNHCPTTRMALKVILEEKNLISKVLIPNDGETLNID